MYRFINVSNDVERYLKLINLLYKTNHDIKLNNSNHKLLLYIILTIKHNELGIMIIK